MDTDRDTCLFESESMCLLENVCVRGVVLENEQLFAGVLAPLSILQRLATPFRSVVASERDDKL